ncbi:DinB family protein [Adhaeribacter aquaticus]|uniref:DinB family protein n=1 Tax=Adhaeribacter aquaticus TaxID=299567 RepID=UPI0006847A4F|nr:DinB family protein [Adhaeribacter aquaticus]
MKKKNLTQLFLHVLLGFLLVAGSVCQLSAATLLTPKSQLVADWQRAKEYTKEYLDAMPEDGISYKPNPEIRSFGEQMLHLANANYNFAAAASGKSNPYQGKNLEKMEEFRSKAALTKAVLDSYDFVISALQTTIDAQLGENVKLFNRDLNRELAYAKAFEHQTHHRGQTTIYLRMKGVKPPAEKLF